MDKNTIEQLVKLNRIAAMHRKAVATPDDSAQREKAALALEAVERSRKALILEILEKDPAAFDAAIEELDRRLR